VGGVEADRREPAHRHKSAHVDDQVVVAEAGSAFGDQDAARARGVRLLHGEPHVPRCGELAALEVHGPPRRAARGDQVGLAPEEGRHLEAIHHLGGHRGLARLVDVREDGEPRLGLHPGEHREAGVDAGAAVGVAAGAVRLVERGLEDEGQAVALRKVPECGRAVEGAFRRLEDVEPGDQRQGRAAADGDLTDAHGLARVHGGRW
jgi:hypothetical protein